MRPSIPIEQDEPPGTYPLDIRRDGSLAGKVPWFRESRSHGELEIRGDSKSGRRSYAAPLQQPPGAPRVRSYAGALVFPRKGCWQITATSGEATLEATVWVIKRAR